MDVLPVSEKEVLLNIVTRIGALLKIKNANPELGQQFVDLKEECEKSYAHKLVAAKHGTYSITLTALEMFESDKIIIHPALEALITLMTEFPELLDQRGINLMMGYLDTQIDLGIQMLVLKWARQCCMKHEMNRQEIFRNKIVTRLKKFLNSETASAPLIRSVCSLVRALILDENTSGIGGNSQMNAQELATETLCVITSLLKKFNRDKETLYELLLALKVLVTRNEFCIKVEEAGGMTSIREGMVNFPDHEKLNHQCLRLLTTLVGNDDVKSHIVKTGVVPLVISAMSRHKSSANVAAAAAMAMAALALRSPENSRALCQAGAAKTVVEVMETHVNNEKVQKQCCWAVRNIVSRDRSLRSQFLTLGIEELLNKVIKTHGKKCDYDAKTALKDLGCSV